MRTRSVAAGLLHDEMDLGACAGGFRTKLDDDARPVRHTVEENIEADLLAGHIAVWRAWCAAQNRVTVSKHCLIDIPNFLVHQVFKRLGRQVQTQIIKKLPNHILMITHIVPRHVRRNNQVPGTPERARRSKWL